MSNPSINRWGLNLFWYRFWYNDKINALTNHQDHLIHKFILLYIHYGLLNKKNLFLHRYWRANINQFLKTYREEIYTKYFRVAQYRNRVTQEYRSYRLRTKAKNLYFSKIWILRYQGWLIVNFYWFQPFKKKKSKYRVFNKEVNSCIIRKNSQYRLFMRYRLISSLLNIFFFNYNYYKF